MRYLILLIPVTCFLFLSCASSGDMISSNEQSQEIYTETEVENCFNLGVLSNEEQVVADSLLYNSLNNTGLHTFTSTLKPMTDIASFRWQVEPTDSLNHPSTSFIDEYERVNRIAEAISCGPLQTIITPFKKLFDGERYIQMRVIRSDAVDRIIAEYPEFWSRWAFAQGSNPGIVVQMMEYEEPDDRFRGYGYLYGYPGHAVDFFVNAAKSESETGEFVKRDFIQMPVVSGRPGTFVYAVPEGHEMNDDDIAIELKAEENVKQFNQLASDYYDEGYFDAASFFRDLFVQKQWVE